MRIRDCAVCLLLSLEGKRISLLWMVFSQCVIWVNSCAVLCSSQCTVFDVCTSCSALVLWLRFGLTSRVTETPAVSPCLACRGTRVSCLPRAVVVQVILNLSGVCIVRSRLKL